MAWLMSNPRTSVKCYSCQGRFGAIGVRVGINLTMEFDGDEGEYVLTPRAYAFLEEHHCKMVASEYRMVFDQATTWAQASFDRFVREDQDHPLLSESNPVVLNAS